MGVGNVNFNKYPLGTTMRPHLAVSYRVSLFLCLSLCFSVSIWLCLSVCVCLSLPIPVHHSIHSPLPPTSVYAKVGMAAAVTEQVRLHNHRRGP